MGNFPPSGLFDGNFHDTGSYKGCLNLKLAGITETSHTSYCTLSFRPVLVSRPKYHNIYRQESQKLINLFSETDPFHKIAEKAQYYHYLYVKTAVCVPSSCSAEDVQSIANTIGQKLVLISGPVKCITRGPFNETNDRDSEIEFGKIENKPVMIYTNSPMSIKQVVALLIVCAYILVITFATISHLARLRSHSARSDSIISDSFDVPNQTSNTRFIFKRTNSSGVRFLDNFSIIANGSDLFDCSVRSRDIKCLHLIRVISMFWIISIHTLQHNDWSGFDRVHENELMLGNFFVHPLLNSNYLVDNFFLMSGLLVCHNHLASKRDPLKQFSFIRSLVLRYLRVTPQVMVLSLLYIILPVIGHGPFWYDMTNDSAKFCEKNCWVNLLHLQAFYKTDEICNLVTWWISVDYFLCIIALVFVYLIYRERILLAKVATTLATLGALLYMVSKHYTMNLPPHNLSIVPQVAEVWTSYVNDFFWSPWPHTFPYMLGFWIGYLIVNENYHRKSIHQFRLKGSMIAFACLIITIWSSYIWTSGSVNYTSPNDHQALITLYNFVCPVLWSSALAWFILVNHFGYISWFNNLSTSGPILILSRLSFIIYLSHLLVVRTYFGLQESTVVLSGLNLTYQMLGNINLSTLFGILLYLTLEGPALRVQRMTSKWIDNRDRA